MLPDRVYTDTGHPTLEIALGRRDADRKMHRAEGGMLRARKTLVEGCQCWRENGGGTRRRRKRSRERDAADGNSRVTRDKDARTKRASEWEDESCGLLPEERHNRVWTGEERRAGGGAQA